MFETAVQEKRTGILWGVVVGLIAFVALLGTGYVFIS
jgi:tetrahydromethanopterin S-methyltransferase subunit G